MKIGSRREEPRAWNARESTLCENVFAAADETASLCSGSWRTKVRTVLIGLPILLERSFVVLRVLIGPPESEMNLRAVAGGKIRRVFRAAFMRFDIGRLEP